MLKSPPQLEAILDQISEGILLYDQERKLLYSNPAAEQILETKEFSNFPLKETSISFKEKELSIRTQPLDTHLLVIIQDVTEFKKLEQLSQRHDRMKELGDMVATVAHELRNPLGGIRGFASLLHRDLKKEPHLQEMAQHIIEGADHLSRFVTNVLNYARPAKAHLQPTDLSLLIEELKSYVEADSSFDSRIKLTTETIPVIAQVDAPLLQSALLNLIVNAVQAMPEGGNLTLKGNQNGDQALLQVIDNGIGISPENISKLFSPFFTTRPNGNGFGLAEVKKIIQVHGGTIQVESELGKGTTFTLKLPKVHS